MTGPARFGRLMRTLQHLGAEQGIAQLVHALRGIRPPRSVPGEIPALSAGAAIEPVLPAPRHARWDASGELELIRRRADFSREVDWDYAGHGPLWVYHLHQCDHLRDASLSPGRRLDAILDWVRNHREGVGWDPHPASLRILSWGKILLTPGAVEPTAEESAEIFESLARQLDHLGGNLEVRLQANHLLSNLIAMVFGGLLFEGSQADAWLGQSGPLSAELAKQFGADGAHHERSPMYHALLVENILDLLNLARARPGRSPAGLVGNLENVAAAGLGAAAVWAQPDGEIALFGDSAFGIAQAPDVLAGYGRSLGVARRLPEPAALLAEAGFARLEAGPLCVLVSIGGPAPAHQPGHAHCDGLAFELAYRGQRVVCDTGVHGYVVGPRRSLARATRSHATVEVGGCDQAEIWAAHRVGGRPRLELIAFEEGAYLEATCISWSTPKTLHRRSFTLGEASLEIRDALEGQPEAARLALPLAPGIEPRLVHDQDGGVQAHLALPGGGRLRVDLPIAADWRIETAPYFPEFGLAVDRACLVGEANAFEAGTWRFVPLD